MSRTAATVAPVARAIRTAGGTAATMLTVYLVLLLAVPSALTIPALGSYGRPSLLWGVVLLVWWLLSRLQRREPEAVRVPQPVRHLLGALIVVALISFALAMLRGQPQDQISPAISALIRLASWSGVVLVAIDGVHRVDDLVALSRRLAIAGGLLAALALVQSVTGLAIVDVLGQIPGLSYDLEVGSRGAFVRAPGTASHPLELMVALAGILPFALAAATTEGFRCFDGPARLNRWWLSPLLIVIASLVSVSRSGIIGLAVAVIASMWFLPVAVRWAVAIGSMVTTGLLAVLVPGLLTSTLYLFVSGSSDDSTASRASGLARVPGFLSASPLFGVGFGTFLPRYYIFDNGIALLTVELGIAGLLVLAVLLMAAVRSARRGRLGPPGAAPLLAKVLPVSLLAMITLFFFFDGFSFPISAGLLFLMIGLCGSLRYVAVADERARIRI